MNIYIVKIWMVVLAGLTLSCSQDDGPCKEIVKEKPAINPSGRYSFIISGGRTQVKGEAPDTRAYLDLDTYAYWWDPEDVVVMAVTEVDNQAAIVSGFENMDLAAMNLQERVLRTTFLADLVQQEYQSLMNSGTHFDFYSYFPTDINGLKKTSFPSYLEFTLPASYTLEPDVFVAAQYAPMVGVVKNKEPEIFFPEEDVDPVYQLGGLHFDYEHILSYAAIEMDVRLLPEDVTSITMTVGAGPNNNTISGTMLYDPSTGYYTLTGSNSVTVNITDGLVAGSGQVVYIPMPVKDLSRHQLSFSFTTANSGSYAYKALDTSSGVNFERGKIHRIRVAPAAQYAVNTSITIPKSGYYYIEAWGGNGGKGGRSYQNETQSAGGIAQRVSGLYYLNAGVSFSLYVGSAGTDKPTGISAGSGAGGAGGTNGLTYGGGGSGGEGYRHPNTIFNGSQYSGAGGGGGAGTFVFAGGTSLPTNLLIVSGGGGGSGGGSGNSSSTYSTGGTGGAGGTSGTISGDGGRATNSGGQGATTFNTTPTGGTGTNGGKGATAKAPGGGGGGGGGGYQFGGNGGTGGSDGGNNSSKGGGGGKGGQSYIATEATNPGYTLPSNSRPSTNGYVIITYFRPKP